MDRIWFQGLLAVIGIMAGIIALRGLFKKPKRYAKTRKAAQELYGKSIRADLSAFFAVYLKQCYFFVAVLVCAIGIVLIAIFVPRTIPEQEPTKSSSQSVTPTIAPAPIVSTAKNPAKLIEFDPLIAKPDAFFMHRWSEFDDIIVSGELCEQSIGVQIPKEDQNNYYANFSQERKLHSEYIEYSTADQYKEMKFEYGIDRTTFQKGWDSEPPCMCRLIIQSVPSDGYVSDSVGIIFDLKWFNYRLSKQPASVALNDVETIRITVFWVFDVIQSKPLAFNLAIINPSLYLA